MFCLMHAMYFVGIFFYNNYIREARYFIEKEIQNGGNKIFKVVQQNWVWVG